MIGCLFRSSLGMMSDVVHMSLVSCYTELERMPELQRELVG